MVLLPASLFVLLSLLTGAAEQENCLEDASQHWQQHHNEQQHCIDKFDEQHRDSLGSSSACAAWADAGECENNAGFMVGHCTKSCNLCAILRNYSARCPAAPNRTPAVVPGQMTSTFERALRPEFSHLKPRLLSREPWLLAFDSFLQPPEIVALLRHGEGRYERSSALEQRQGHGVSSQQSEVRTSTSTWCRDACKDDPHIRRIYERVSNVTRVPAANFELLQLLKYESCPRLGHVSCQYYRSHHDVIEELGKMLPGPRVYTFFL